MSYLTYTQILAPHSRSPINDIHIHIFTHKLNCQYRAIRIHFSHNVFIILISHHQPLLCSSSYSSAATLAFDFIFAFTSSSLHCLLTRSFSSFFNSAYTYSCCWIFFFPSVEAFHLAQLAQNFNTYMSRDRCDFKYSYSYRACIPLQLHFFMHIWIIINHIFTAKHRHKLLLF